MSYISIAFSQGLTVGNPIEQSVETFRAQQTLDPRYIPQQTVSEPVNIKGALTDVIV